MGDAEKVEVFSAIFNSVFMNKVSYQMRSSVGSKDREGYPRVS